MKTIFSVTICLLGWTSVYSQDIWNESSNLTEEKGSWMKMGAFFRQQLLKPKLIRSTKFIAKKY